MPCWHQYISGHKKVEAKATEDYRMTKMKLTTFCFDSLPWQMCFIQKIKINHLRLLGALQRPLLNCAILEKNNFTFVFISERKGDLFFFLTSTIIKCWTKLVRWLKSFSQRQPNKPFCFKFMQVLWMMRQTLLETY